MIEFRVEGALPGDEVKLARHEKGRQLRVRARAWGNAGRMLPVELEIIRHGEGIRKTTPDSDSQSELSLDFEVDAGFGFWIAARAKGSDGSQAHTTPVYVVQEPLRFWKHEAAQELIATRLDSLAEIEKLVADTRRLEKDGKAGYVQKQPQPSLPGASWQEISPRARKVTSSSRPGWTRNSSLSRQVEI